jgi:hypothetical protein
MPITIAALKALRHPKSFRIAALDGLRHPKLALA